MGPNSCILPNGSCSSSIEGFHRFRTLFSGGLSPWGRGLSARLPPNAKRGEEYYSSRISRLSSCMAFLASEKSIRVLSRVKSRFGMPAKPGLRLRLTTTTT